MTSVLAALVLLGAASTAPSGCTCAVAVETGGWCDVHELGYVGPVEIRSKLLYHALDAHGHQVDRGSFQCDSCQAGVASDGYCDRHGIGFVEGQAYFSHLAYHLAKGQRVSKSEITCPACRRNAEDHGWCEAHGVGMVGPIRIGDTTEFEHVAEAIRRLQAANEIAKRCEHCAVASVTDTTCPVCRIAYEDGKPSGDD